MEPHLNLPDPSKPNPPEEYSAEDFVEESKPAFYKRKFFLIPLAVVLVAIIVAAAILYTTTHVTVTVGEALSSTTATCVISGFPGESKTCLIDVTNSANVSLNTALAWNEISNPNAVSYTTDLPRTINLSPGANTITVQYTIAADSPTGIFEGNVSLSRV